MAFNAPSSFKSNDSGYETGPVEALEPKHTTKHDPAREMARQQQNMLAVELSKQVEEEYQHDILDHMLRLDVSTPGSCYQATLLTICQGRDSCRR